QGGFHVQNLPTPSPHEGEVLIKIMACGLNPMDPVMHDLNLFVPSYPFVFGGCGVGIVQDVGEGVKRFKNGDKVGGMGGAFQQYRIVEENLVFRVPDNLSFDEAATFPVPLATSVIGLFDDFPHGIGLNPDFSLKETCKGQTALVIGGSTSVGQYAIQLLKLLEFAKIIAYASNTHAPHLKSLGATEVIDRHTISLDQLGSKLQEPKFDVIVDIVGTPESQKAVCDCLRNGGRFLNVNIRLHPGIEERLNEGDKKVANVFASYNRASVAFRERAWEGVPLLLEQKHVLVSFTFDPCRYEVLPGGLAGIVPGIERLRKKDISGIKLIGRPFDE
ncbi:GroES-like protein, partial [Atractiella rhizophila]